MEQKMDDLIESGLRLKEYFDELSFDCAVKIMKWHQGVIEETNQFVWWQGRNPKSLKMDVGKWTPSELNSGQIWDVLDAMNDMGYSIVLRSFDDFRTEIYLKGSYVCSNYCLGKSRRNAMIIECCLKALSLFPTNAKSKCEEMKDG